MPARNTIEVIITGDDRTGSAMSSATSAVENLGKSLTSLGSTLTGIGLPFLGIATKAFNAFDEMDDAADQLTAVLQSTAGAAGVTRQEVLKMGSALQDASTFTRASIVSGENLLLTFTNIGKKVFPRATQALVDMATAMKTDVKSQAIQLGKALNDPIQGLTALTRVGVAFTDQQKDMIKAMVEAGDVAGAQTVILDELAKEFGGSAAAQVDTMSQLGNGLNELFLQIGSVLQPVIDAIGAVVLPILDQVIDALNGMAESGDYTVGIIIAIGASLVVLGPIIAGIGLALSFLPALFAGPLIPIMAVIAGLVLLAQHFQITGQQIQLYLSLAALYAGYYIGQIIDKIRAVITAIKDWMDKHPAFGAALILITGFIIGVAIAVALLNVALGVFGVILGFLLSPVVLLIAAIAALLFVIEETYPGGISGILRDAGTAAQQLAYVFSYYLAKAVNYIQNRLAEFQVTVHNAALAWLDFAHSVVNNPFMQSIVPGLKETAGLFNQMYDIEKKIFGNSVFTPQGPAAPIPFVPPVPPGGTPTVSNTANPATNQQVSGLLDLVKDLSKNQNLTVNFNGSGGPTSQGEANTQADMLKNALQKTGVNP